MGQPTESLYDQVLRVSRVYLGPATERFINRQIENHLAKEPDALSHSDLANLIDWIKAAVSMLTEDAEIVEEYMAELAKLINAPDQPGES